MSNGYHFFAWSVLLAISKALSTLLIYKLRFAKLVMWPDNETGFTFATSIVHSYIPGVKGIG